MQNGANVLYCPCCQQPVEGAKFLADPDSGIITNGQKSVRMRKQQFRLAAFLIRKFPAMASKESIYDEVFMYSNGDGPSMKIIDVQICHIRPLLAEIGLVIETVWGKGYRLVEADADMALAIKDTSVRLRENGGHRWKPEYDTKLLDLMKRNFTVSHCATVLRLPYMTVERAIKRLEPQLSLVPSQPV